MTTELDKALAAEIAARTTLYDLGQQRRELQVQEANATAALRRATALVRDIEAAEARRTGVWPGREMVTK